MVGNLKLVARKYRSDGVKETLSSAWMDFWEKFVLNDHITPRIIDRWGYPIKFQEEMSADAINKFLITPSPSTDSNDRVSVPSKKWMQSGTEFSELNEYQLPHPSVYEFDDVTLFATTGLCLSKDQEYIADSVTPPSRVDTRIVVSLSKSMIRHGPVWTFRSMLRSRQNTLKPAAELDLVMPLIPLWMGYYHWIVEMLPRIMGAEQYYKETGERPTLLVPSALPSWAQESLDMVSKGEYKIEQVQQKTYNVNRLILPTYPEPSPEACSWMRERVRNQSVKSDFSRRIYISRQKANRRRVINESAVVSMLAEYGFDSVVLEDLSIAEQIGLFSQAECIVGPHGAGFANMIYGTDPTIIEIFGDQKKTTFYRLAKILNNDYQSIRCRTVRKDIQVNTAKVKRTIDQKYDSCE